MLGIEEFGRAAMGFAIADQQRRARRKMPMMIPSTAGFRCAHSTSFLVTETKSCPNITNSTPAMDSSASASGALAALSSERIQAPPVASTVWPGKNLSVAGLGVGSVWINIGSPQA